MTTNHTPGPWIQCDAHGPIENGTCAMDSGGLLVASCTGYFGRDGAIANARLIAASPDLLVAAALALDWMRSHGALLRDMAPLESAIAKATGTP